MTFKTLGICHCITPTPKYVQFTTPLNPSSMKCWPLYTLNNCQSPQRRNRVMVGPQFANSAATLPKVDLHIKTECYIDVMYDYCGYFWSKTWWNRIDRRVDHVERKRTAEVFNIINHFFLIHPSIIVRISWNIVTQSNRTPTVFCNQF